LIIEHMFVFRNRKLPDSSPSFTPFRGREASREKCKKKFKKPLVPLDFYSIYP
jgi:hypothetical protein